MIKKAWAMLLSFMLLLNLSGCAMLDSQMSDLKGSLIGNEFNIKFYDNNGIGYLTVVGHKVDVEGVTVETNSVDEDGEKTTNYELSSVISITVDGSNMEQVGNTVIFEESGLNKVTDFKLPEEIIASGGTFTALDRQINDVKNIFGTSKLVVISSQLGVPIAVYGGNSVYWEVPDDLPKMTKLNIDGKALYIHRANYIILDTSLLK